jgi:Putative beta-barrel porin-2, OmpL-like. bbp2
MYNRPIMKKYLIILLGLCPIVGSGQTDTPDNRLQFSGYAEIYYAYDFNQPEDHNRPAFLYSHNRHNEFNLNLGFIKGGYAADRVRANLALGAGTYMNANYAAEPGVLSKKGHLDRCRHFFVPYRF